MRRLLLPLSLLAVLLAVDPARGHGGLPLSREILWRQGALYLPTDYWGIFVSQGEGAGPWHWICDEAINSYRLRQVSLGGDGTLYATDLVGFSISRDGGCSWEPTASELSRRDLIALVPDPQAPLRVWAVTVEHGQPVLWRSEDGGRSFQERFRAQAHAQPGLVVSPDGQRLLLTALRVEAGAAPEPMLYVSTDGAMHFVARALVPRPPFLRTVPAGVDPVHPRTVYVLSHDDINHVLLRVDADTGQTTRVLELDRRVYRVVADGERGRLLVPTEGGLYLSEAGGPLRRVEGLSRAQCASVRPSGLFVCSWNYFPDHAAVALSTDGGASFRSLFQFAETRGVLACPEGSSVARLCPQEWQRGAPLLGIEVEMRPDMGRAEDMGPGCGCTVGRQIAEEGRGWAVGLVLMLWGAARRRRYRSWGTRSTG
ncbi:MAG: hypothetical protein RMK29_11655 [Myxococcales bacterium]|nr:hypothetical protein [Myxococcota bacterium]MDW8282363.1 hypothetical protein [Myxococcales bacterium]